MTYSFVKLFSFSGIQICFKISALPKRQNIFNQVLARTVVTTMNRL